MKKISLISLIISLFGIYSCGKKENPLPTTTLIINPETQKSEKTEEKKTEVKNDTAAESQKQDGHWDKAGHEIKEGFKTTGHEIKKGSEKAGSEMKKGFEKAGHSIKDAFK